MKDKHLLLQIWFLALLSMILGVACISAAHFLTPEPIVVEVAGKLVRIPSSDPYAKFLLKELGFALLIAAFLAVTFEYLTKSKHEEAADRLAARMNEKLFHTVLGRDIPPSLYEHIRRCALNTELFRTDFRVFFTLGTAGKDEANPDDKKYIRLSEETQYKVKNISNATKSFRLGMYLDPVIFPPQDNVPLPEFRFVKVNGKNVHFEEAGWTTSSAEVNAYYEVELSPGEELKVDSSSFCYLRLTDEQVFTMRDPTDGIAVTLISHLPYLSLDCYALHCSQLVMIRNEDTSKEWILEEALIAGQGVIVKWSDVASPIPRK